jgi:hypothetical protein
MPTTDLWPYDADRDDPLTALRIPVTGMYPGATYTACFDRESQARPTDAEARMIASFIEQYQDYHFGDGHWRRVQQAKPFDMDCYTTAVFHKWGEGDWSYRITRWEYPHWLPYAPHVRGSRFDHHNLPAMTLEQVMDYAHKSWPDRWETWKTAHPDAFPQATA